MKRESLVYFTVLNNKSFIEIVTDLWIAPTNILSETYFLIISKEIIWRILFLNLYQDYLKLLKGEVNIKLLMVSLTHKSLLILNIRIFFEKIKCKSKHNLHQIIGNLEIFHHKNLLFLIF